MTGLRERARKWLPHAGAAALLLLGVACSSAYHQSPPLQSNAGGTAGTGEAGGAVVATASAQADLEQILNAPARGTTRFGYLDQQVGPTSYRTLFLAKLKPTYAITVKQRNFEAESYLTFANDMALLQAAKLAMDSGYAGFTVANREDFLHVIVQNNRFDDPTYRKCVESCQTLDCGCRPTYYDYTKLGTPAGLGTYGHYDFIDARVLMSFDLVKEAAPGAYDAKEAIAKLHQKYPLLAPESGEPAATPASQEQAPAAPATQEQTPAGTAPENPQPPAQPADIPPQEPPKTN